MTIDAADRARVLVEALPYIKRFHGQTGKGGTNPPFRNPPRRAPLVGVEDNPTGPGKATPTRHAFERTVTE